MFREISRLEILEFNFPEVWECGSSGSQVAQCGSLSFSYFSPKSPWGYIPVTLMQFPLLPLPLLPPPYISESKTTWSVSPEASHSSRVESRLRPSTCHVCVPLCFSICYLAHGRRKKTGWRRRIVNKEDLVAEDRKRRQRCLWAPDQGRVRCQSTATVHRHYHNHSLAHYWVQYWARDGHGEVFPRATVLGLTVRASRSIRHHCLETWGVLTSLSWTHIYIYTLFTFSWSDETEERRLVEEEGSLTKKTWLQKKENSKERG